MKGRAIMGLRYAVVLLTPPANWQPKSAGHLPPDVLSARISKRRLRCDIACRAAYDFNIMQIQRATCPEEWAAVVCHRWTPGSTFNPRSKKSSEVWSPEPPGQRHAVILLTVPPGWHPASFHGLPPSAESARFMVRNLRYEAACHTALGFNMGQIQYARFSGEWAAPVRDLQDWAKKQAMIVHVTMPARTAAAVPVEAAPCLAAHAWNEKHSALN